MMSSLNDGDNEARAQAADNPDEALIVWVWIFSFAAALAAYLSDASPAEYWHFAVAAGAGPLLFGSKLVGAGLFRGDLHRLHNAAFAACFALLCISTALIAIELVSVTKEAFAPDPTFSSISQSRALRKLTLIVLLVPAVGALTSGILSLYSAARALQHLLEAKRPKNKSRQAFPQASRAVASICIPVASCLLVLGLADHAQEARRKERSWLNPWTQATVAMDEGWRYIHPQTATDATQPSFEKNGVASIRFFATSAPAHDADSLLREMLRTSEGPVEVVPDSSHGNVSYYRIVHELDSLPHQEYSLVALTSEHWIGIASAKTATALSQAFRLHRRLAHSFMPLPPVR